MMRIQNTKIVEENLKLLGENWDNIRKRVVFSLWKSTYKTMYESVKLDYDDFESLAGMVLTEAMGTFNPEKSNLFTYATNVVKNKAMTELRNCTQRDVRKALYVSDSVDSLDRSIIENISYTDNREDANILSDKMVRYLDRLSILQKQILFLMSDGFDNDEIKKTLKISEKDLSNSLCGIRAYRNVSLLF